MRRALRWLIVGVILAGLVALGPARGTISRWVGPDRAYSRDHQRLLDSVGPERSIPARLSGGSSYRPYNPLSLQHSAASALPGLSLTTRSGDGAVRLSSGIPFPSEIVKAIRRTGEKNAPPEDRATLATLNLLGGDPDEAVRLLQEAHGKAPDDPRILNDLAAALLAVHQATGDPWSAIEALEIALRAERLEPTLPVLFNKALALEALGARSRAIAAWDRYLAADRDSGWAQEASERQAKLKRAIEEAPRLLTVPPADVTAFEDNPWANRQLAERTLLARWAENTLAGRSADAETALSRAEDLAAMLTPEASRLLKASIAAIREAEQAGDQKRLDLLARGHEAFGRAFVLRRAEQTSEAGKLIETAIHALQAAGSPFETRARLLRAWMAEPPDWREFRALQQAAFPSIAAEAKRIAAYRMTLEGRLESSVRAYQDARRRYLVMGEREEAAALSVMSAELLEMLGRRQETIQGLSFALEVGPWVADPWNRYSIYVVATSIVDDQLSRAAVELRLEAADACQDLPERPLCAVDSSLRIAAITPDFEVAEEALQRADELLASAPDSDGKKRTEIDLTAARARWLGGEDRSTPEKEEAAALYGEAAEAYEAQGLALSTARSRVRRARVFERMGLTRLAVAEYQASLRGFRQWDERDRFRPNGAEKGSPWELRQAYEALLGVELDLAAPRPSVAAFLLSEEMRDRLTPRRTTGLWLPSLEDLQRLITAVPPGTAVIEYAVAGERTVAWILAGGRLEQVILAPGDDLEGRIQSLAEHRHTRDLDGWQSTSGKIFQDLLAPVLKRLPAGTTRLILIPDSELYSVPFRALWNPASNRYLDEDFTISLAPSARQLLGRATDTSKPVSRQLIALSVGFTSFSPELDLEKLPHAIQEAAAVRALYRGEDCPVTDWAAFRRCAPTASVLHLATHASADSSGSGQTWLALEQETVSLDRLWKELPELPRHPLVVLSACQSVASAGGGEGLGGLARPFLASGARAVVGTLWKIDDEYAATFLPAFHRAYRDSQDPAAALSKAREEQKRWRETPWMWGGVETVNAGL